MSVNIFKQNYCLKCTTCFFGASQCVLLKNPIFSGVEFTKKKTYTGELAKNGGGAWTLYTFIGGGGA